MKYTTALTVFLAFGPATSVLAAPLVQGSGSALTAGPAPGGEGAAHPAGAAPGGSSSQGLSGSSMGNEGVLDKVEKILKDVLGGLRKRGIVSEVGDVAKKTLDSTSKLLNGEKSGSQSSYSTQSTDPHALPPTAPAAAPAAPAPAPAPADDSSSGSGSGSDLSQLLSGRSLVDQIDPVNTSGTTAPISNNAAESNKLPANPAAAAPATKESAPLAVAPLDTQNQNVQEEKKEMEGPNNGTPTTDPFKLTPEEIEALTMILASQGKGQGAGEAVPGLSDA